MPLLLLPRETFPDNLRKCHAGKTARVAPDPVSISNNAISAAAVSSGQHPHGQSLLVGSAAAAAWARCVRCHRRRSSRTRRRSML